MASPMARLITEYLLLHRMYVVLHRIKPYQLIVFKAIFRTRIISISSPEKPLRRSLEHTTQPFSPLFASLPLCRPLLVFPLLSSITSSLHPFLPLSQPLLQVIHSFSSLRFGTNFDFSSSPFFLHIIFATPSSTHPQAFHPSQALHILCNSFPIT